MTIYSQTVGVPMESAQAIAGTPVVVNLTTIAGGASQNGYIVTSDLQIVTTADSTNKVLTLPDPAKYGGTAGDSFTVVNAATGQTLSVYPPTGGNISGAGANTAASITTNKTTTFRLASFTSSTSVWTSQVGA